MNRMFFGSIILTVAFGVIGCSDAKSNYIGTWTEEGQNTPTLEFKNDNTCALLGKIISGNRPSCSWSDDPAVIVMKGGGHTGSMPMSFKDNQIIVNFDGRLISFNKVKQ